MVAFDPVRRHENTIAITGNLGMGEFHRLIGVIFDATSRRGYQDITLDFSQCTATFNAPMLSVCAQIQEIRNRGISTHLILPNKETLAKLFISTNWAYTIDPNRFNMSSFRGFSHVPVTHFSDANQQAESVDKIINAILCSMDGLSREDLASIEWAINEITDNVLVHSNSKNGGFVQLTTFKGTRPRIEYAVCDAGVGIPATLKPAHKHIQTDMDALDQAIREGVTNGLGMGNGLFGSFEVSRISGGYFQIHSGNARLAYDQRSELHLRDERVPYSGTLVVACIECTKTGVLAEALKFGGKQHKPIDFIEMRYEADDEIIEFNLLNETLSFGTRLVGIPIRRKLLNLYEMSGGQKIIIDMSGIPVISSSFADEVLGKIFMEIGQTNFNRRFGLKNMNKTVHGLIERALTQRGYSSRR
ncbi:hypothetical protein Gbem_2791 [Citrifermentans bemidjiense Bem]|uniref:DUF4325 domain-containing protein n=1 Tax=Citrifermentans bemidjiense (strain ATCC BAA-1014 / DSM 16622 / JCM 12645 / Bem) TaxID=404380 RepID=B5EI93_CITBB|nr:DUF4325 domain-containing protein [Citrifermentans bemidjiense]ACH39795.2 hypothetical protein Gbem_2791 [Citrifermentans bemidjiense Bem]